MKISARVDNSFRKHVVTLATNDAARELPIPSRADGVGSSANGGELLCLALATCYCNDLYREAARLGMSIESVEVQASGEFPGVGLAATNITYRAKVISPAPAAEVAELLRVTDAVAEIHNTVRSGVPVTLERS